MEEINRTIIILLMLVFICAPLTSHLWARSEPAVDLRVDVKYTAQELRDPFESYITKEKVTGEAARVEGAEAVTERPLPSLVVQGIIWGGSFPQAIINNKVVKIGDEIEGVRIIDISKDGVIVSYGLRSYNLSAPGIVQMENLQKKPEGGKNENQF